MRAAAPAPPRGPDPTTSLGVFRIKKGIRKSESERRGFTRSKVKGGGRGRAGGLCEG